MEDMVPRDWIAGVESPETGTRSPGLSCAALIASLAESRSTETINQHHAFGYDVKTRFYNRDFFAS